MPRARTSAPRRRRIGVIDIGTNSTKLLVGEVYDGSIRTIAFDRRASRIGEKLSGSGRISTTAAARTARDVAALGKVAREYGSGTLVAVGTYALRTAANGTAVAKRISRESGVPVRILTGEEEATLSYLSALLHIPNPKPNTFVLDVGGGSVEFIAARRGHVVEAKSLPLGALRLTERHLHSDPPAPKERRALEREVNAAVARLTARFRRVPAARADFVACGGTATTAVTMLGRRAYGSRATVRVAELQALTERCFLLTIAQRKRMPGLPADRADIIPAGLAVVLAFARAVGKRSIIVSDGGVREGVLLAIDAELHDIEHDTHSH